MSSIEKIKEVLQHVENLHQALSGITMVHHENAPVSRLSRAVRAELRRISYELIPLTQEGENEENLQISV